MESPTQLFDDIARLAQRYQLPGFDMGAVLKGRRKDVEALLEVGRITQGSAQSLGQKQAEMLRASMEDLRNVLRTPPNASGAQAAGVRQAADKAINHIAELAQIALQSQADAFDTARQRAQENIDELKALGAKAK